MMRDGVHDLMGSALSDKNGHNRYDVADATVQRLLEDPVPLFGRKGGYVYILPETKPLEAVFPRLIVQAAPRSTA